jgi:hypothetical protein
MFRKLDLSPQVRGWQTPTLLGTVERDEVQWSALALSNGPKRLAVSHLLAWEREQIQFPKYCVFFLVLFRIPNDGLKSKNPVISGEIHQSQTPFESTSYEYKPH